MGTDNATHRHSNSPWICSDCPGGPDQTERAIKAEDERDRYRAERDEARKRLAQYAVEGDRHDGSCLQVKAEALAKADRYRAALENIQKPMMTVAFARRIARDALQETAPTDG